MGKNPWEDLDNEVVALEADMQPKGPKRWLRLVVGLVVVGTLTFIGGYYVPLFRAHTALRDEFQQLSERRRTLDETLAQAQRDHQRLDKEKGELKARLDERLSQEQKRKEQLEELRSKISSKLRALETKGLAGSAVEGETLLVALSNRGVFSPHTLAIPGKAANHLCDVVQTAKGFPLKVASMTTSKEPPSIRLAAKYPSLMELNAVRGAIVSNRIDKDCPVDGGPVQSVASVDGDEQKVAGVKLPAIVLQLELPPDAG